ncbi:hypothetical protein R50073_38960 [Maricurvus nonylphenolicus]|uniref:prepilin-type N-terminal cleavage/methylation domain-containing protein n=1 Tax=Maricurvus nonylphenolicus TaxID=1008307 RepID=UPI0036F1FD8A
MYEKSSQQGFSLLEMLLVLMLVAITTMMASLSLGDDRERQLRYQAKHFSALMRVAVETSALNGEVMGLYFIPQSQSSSEDQTEKAAFQWRRLRDGEWQKTADDFEIEGFEVKGIWQPESLRIEVEGEFISLSDIQLMEKPLALIYPSGEATLFNLAFVDSNTGDIQQQVILDSMAVVHWHDGSS